MDPITLSNWQVSLYLWLVTVVPAAVGLVALVRLSIAALRARRAATQEVAGGRWKPFAIALAKWAAVSALFVVAVIVLMFFHPFMDHSGRQFYVFPILGLVTIANAVMYSWAILRLSGRANKVGASNGVITSIAIMCALNFAACRPASLPQATAGEDRAILVGAWRSQVTFKSGPLAEMKDLQFLYAYNAGGTMTESSNYDEAANSSPPAYGVWKKVAPRKFETKYVFFTTQAAQPGDGKPTTSDWWPDGHGVLAETITLSDDGQTYTSTIKLVLHDKNGAPIDEGSEGTGTGRRIEL